MRAQTWPGSAQVGAPCGPAQNGTHVPSPEPNCMHIDSGPQVSRPSLALMQMLPGALPPSALSGTQTLAVNGPSRVGLTPLHLKPAGQSCRSVSQASGSPVSLAVPAPLELLLEVGSTWLVPVVVLAAAPLLELELAGRVALVSLALVRSADGEHAGVSSDIRQNSAKRGMVGRVAGCADRVGAIDSIG